MKGIARGLTNRLFHLMARQLPGAYGFRLRLHRWRGVKVGTGVFIGDEVYLENEYPERIELQDGVQLSIRAIIIAHTRGPGWIIIEKDAYVGPNAVVATSAGTTLRIGEGGDRSRSGHHKGCARPSVYSAGRRESRCNCHRAAHQSGARRGLRSGARSTATSRHDVEAAGSATRRTRTSKRLIPPWPTNRESEASCTAR
jgi:hypothetical protein